MGINMEAIKTKILIVDDNEESLYMLESLLKGGGYQTIAAVNGVEALERLKNEFSIDLIISDILMPKMDGFRLCRECNSDQRLKKIPFIFYSATYKDQKDQDLGKQLGAVKYLLKPLEPERLLEIIQQLLFKDENDLPPQTQIDPKQLNEDSQLSEYNERLVKKLEKKMLQLEESNRKLRASEAQLHERTRALHCLYSISRLVEQDDISPDELMQRIVNLIPAAWQYAEDACARLILEGREFVTDNFKETIWQQSVDITVDKNRIGSLEVFYLVERPASDEGSFLREERNLIDQVAQRLGDVVEKQRDEEQKAELQARLMQSQKMEAIGTLASGIAHDFNNLLQVITGFTQLTTRKMDRTSGEYINLMKVLDSSKRAAELVRQILTYSRKDNLEMQPLDMKHIIEETLKLLRSSLPTTIKIVQQINHDGGLVMANATQMQQVIMNLCTNAKHAMQETGGELKIELTEVEIKTDDSISSREMQPGKYIRLTVSDNGYGMTTEVQARIFDPYYTTKEKDIGTGLGLSVVEGIVKKHRGYITVDSQPDQGTKFQIHWPQLESMATPDIIDDQSLPEGKERILLVDDDHSIATLEKDMLESLGYQIVALTSPQEALDIFRDQPQNYDLVITDQTMPQLTGYQLAVKMMAIRNDIPIILCTGYSETVNRKKSEHAGIKEFIMKPFLLEEIAIAIRRALDQ